uniref:Ribosomal RNA-processing protein 40 n=1 Tax=Quercus lobata TaxID=97700 RepID=A0A7N2L306_QUELO
MENKPTSSPTSFVDQSVVPGDVVLDLSNMTNQTLKLGGGLRQDCDAISVMKAGKLRFSNPNKYWVESSQKRHSLGFVIPLLDLVCIGWVFWMVLVVEEIGKRSVVLVGSAVGSAEAGTEGTRMAELGTAAVGIVELSCGDELIRLENVRCVFPTSIRPQGLYFDRKLIFYLYVPHAGDSVLGIVVDSKADNFLVDIKGPGLAFLPVLAFEGGTRRNIPRFEIGTLLYVRLVKANPGMNPELSCTDASGKAAEFGQLKDGYMFESSTGLSRMLLSSPTCPVLDALGKKLSFETAVGLNGRVWVNASSPSTVIVVANAIMNSESLSGVQQRIMVEKLIQNLKLST